MASSGAVSPIKAAKDVFDTAEHHLAEASQLTFVKNIYGALLLSAAGLLSLILETGSPELTRSNPGIAQVLQGLTFPIGLVLVYFIGAELYTGYPMWFAMLLLERKGSAVRHVRKSILSWIGNLIGSIFFAGFFSYLTEIMNEEPFRSGAVDMITKDIVDKQWHVIFLKAILCGFLVTLAMYYGTQCHDGISKALALYLPFFIATAAKCPHTVEYMYLGSISMMLGAPLSIGEYFWKCLLPITLGNTIGGALFTGAYLWWVFLVCGDERAGEGDANGWPAIRLSSED